jgi:hypothetical protein
VTWICTCILFLGEVDEVNEVDEVDEVGEVNEGWAFHQSAPFNTLFQSYNRDLTSNFIV